MGPPPFALGGIAFAFCALQSQVGDLAERDAAEFAEDISGVELDAVLD